ncbi:MAG TPA: ROK family protein [Spirochaetes bacterium]|nr:ROK family protein [Spirochaetota bacterium]
MYIGIDIGGTSVKAVLTDTKGTLIQFSTISTWKKREEIEPVIRALLNSLLKNKAGAMQKVTAIGAGTAGSLDTGRGTVLESPNIPSLARFPLAATIRNISGKPVFVENDATVAVMGERWLGHGRKYQNWIMLTLGTGIGGGAVIHGKPYTGQYGSSMEVGHTSIDYRGRKCPCGSRGCLELYCSATSLTAYTRRLLNRYPRSSLHRRIRAEGLNPRIVEEEALKGDTLSSLVYERVSTWLGYGIANLVNLFNPEAIIFGGGLSRAHGLIFPVVKQVVHERVLEGLDKNVKYLTVKDPTRGPSLGAAKIAIDALGRGEEK